MLTQGPIVATSPDQGGMWSAMPVLAFLLWLSLTIYFIVMFYRGMNALVQMSRSMARIEQLLVTRVAPPATRDVGGI